MLALELALGVGGKATDRQGALHAVAGYSARGVVFGLIGVFVVHAGWVAKPRDAIGLDGALRKLVDAPYGPLLLGVVAAGLLAYTVYCLVQARYRDV